MALVERERLVTLTGVGGIGKTRLALGVAAALAAGFSDGCWLVELSPVADGEEVLKTVAAAVRAPATTLDALVDYLADRRVLIVLDNCEHVLDAAADLVDAVAVAAADVHVLVTSREPLGLDGEQVRRVHSLALPPAEAAPAEAEASAAVRLFAERAVAVSDGFTIDRSNVAAVVEICRHLDGIPLAIELAAARVRAMAPAEIARRLDERFRLLAGGSRRSQERHRTLLATVSWSHDLLTDEEKITFRRLAVFPASFDLAAAEAVAGDGAVDVVDCVLRLVDRSLVMYEPDQDRYRLLETLRQYGADRLAEASETDETRERHARYFLAFAERVEPELNDARFTAAYAAVAAELDNFRATADWLVESDLWVELADICQQLWEFLMQAAPVDGAGWYQHVVDHQSALDHQAAIDAVGRAAYAQVMNLGNYALGLDLAAQSTALATANHLPESQFAWAARASLATYTGESVEAVRCAELALVAANARGAELHTVIALSMQIIPLYALGEFDRGAAVAAETLRRAEQTGHPIYTTTAVITAGSGVLWGTADGDLTASLDLLTRHDGGLTFGEISGMWLDLMWGSMLLALDQPGAVERLARAARAADRLNAPHALDLALRQLAILAAESDLTEPAAALVVFTETNLRPHRIENPGSTRVQARLDRAVAAVPRHPSEVLLHRGEVVALIAEIETSLTQQDASTRATAD